jgi:hypothetical protein
MGVVRVEVHGAPAGAPDAVERLVAALEGEAFRTRIGWLVNGEGTQAYPIVRAGRVRENPD